MNEIIIYLAIFITGFIIIELIVRNIVKSINKDFQWLIIEKDEAPKLSKQGLRKFLLHGYDPELGWVRKPNTSHDEIGKKETTTWHIDETEALEKIHTWDQKNLKYLVMVIPLRLLDK